MRAICKTKLEKLKILPLATMYFELHDVLLLSFLKGNFDIDLPIRLKSEKNTMTKQDNRIL